MRDEIFREVMKSSSTPVITTPFPLMTTTTPFTLSTTRVTTTRSAIQKLFDSQWWAEPNYKVTYSREKYNTENPHIDDKTFFECNNRIPPCNPTRDPRVLTDILPDAINRYNKLHIEMPTLESIPLMKIDDTTHANLRKIFNETDSMPRIDNATHAKLRKMYNGTQSILGLLKWAIQDLDRAYALVFINWIVQDMKAKYTNFESAQYSKFQPAYQQMMREELEAYFIEIMMIVRPWLFVEFLSNLSDDQFFFIAHTQTNLFALYDLIEAHPDDYYPPTNSPFKIKGNITKAMLDWHEEYYKKKLEDNYPLTTQLKSGLIMRHIDGSYNFDQHERNIKKLEDLLFADFGKVLYSNITAYIRTNTPTMKLLRTYHGVELAGVYVHKDPHIVVLSQARVYSVVVHELFHHFCRFYNLEFETEEILAQMYANIVVPECPNEYVARALRVRNNYPFERLLKNFDNITYTKPSCSFIS